LVCDGPAHAWYVVVTSRLFFAVALTAGCGSGSGHPGAQPDAHVGGADAGADAGAHSLHVATDGETSCAIRDGALYCWGANDFGQVMAPAGGSVLVPTEVVGISDAIAVETRLAVTCVARASGTTECWGSGYSGMTVVSGLDGAVEIRGADHSWCARRSNGEVRCWGATGLLGDGTTASRSDARPASLPEPVIQLDGNYQTFCAVAASGGVYCWGADFLSTPVRVMDLEPAVQVVAGGMYDSTTRVHVCALGSDGTVRCRGNNMYGQLGQPPSSGSHPAVEIAGVAGTSSLHASGSSTVAVTAGGTLRCWGEPCGSSVITVDGVSDVVDLSYTVPSSCAVFGDHAIRCWGGNHDGQLGDGTTADHALPATITW
jgi:alpha-tubulin suppressor-like RCC1 family protein